MWERLHKMSNFCDHFKLKQNEIFEKKKKKGTMSKLTSTQQKEYSPHGAEQIQGSVKSWGWQKGYFNVNSFTLPKQRTKHANVSYWT